MAYLNKKIILIFLIIVLLVWIMYPTSTHNGSETFTSDEQYDVMPSLESLTSGRYGLRGDKLRRSSIYNWYMSPDRQIMLNDSSGEMWQANGTPPSFGIKDCRVVKCPINGEYDNLDTCWKCGNDCQTKMIIPDMQPHVKI